MTSFYESQSTITIRFQGKEVNRCMHVSNINGDLTLKASNLFWAKIEELEIVNTSINKGQPSQSHLKDIFVRGEGQILKYKNLLDEVASEIQFSINLADEPTCEIAKVYLKRDVNKNVLEYHLLLVEDIPASLTPELIDTMYEIKLYSETI